MVERYRPLTPFAQAFASEYKGFMRAHGVTNLQIAGKLERNDGYVSERVNGRRALDTEDVDALAMLVPGWTGKTLMAELARRVQISTSDGSHLSVVGGEETDEPRRSDYAIAALEQPDYQKDQEDGEELP